MVNLPRTRRVTLPVNCRTLLPTALFVAVALLGPSRPALALLAQTASDLEVLEDSLKQALEDDPGLAARVTPLLLATPVHFWTESRADFGEAATRVLKSAFPGANDLINCPDCDAWRLHVREGAGLDINNGELGLTELGRLKQDPRYGAARALAMVQETPAGVELRIIELADGRIVYHKVADSTERLSDVKPWLGYQAERDRRLRGESLSYVFVNLGLYPQGLFQVEYVEQWGDHNQHISGVALSLFNPTLAVGAVYHYLIPGVRRLHVSASLYLPLQNAIQSAVNNQSAATAVVGQGMVQYAFANSYAVFASVSSAGVFSLGFNFYNPLFMPFLL